MTKSKWAGMYLAILAGIWVFSLPTPAGLSKPAQSVLGIAAFTILLWLFKVTNNGVASILMMGLLIVVGVRPQLALGGFSSPSFWILLCVLYYGFAMHRVGLAQRLSYLVLSLFPGTYTGLLTAFFIIGSLLTLGIPSMTVRTAIIVPIAWALVKSLEIPERSRSAALIILTSIEMAVIPGCAFLYGSLNGPIVDSLFRTKHFPLDWLSYAKVMAVPTLILCALLIAANQLALRPERRLQSSPDFVRERLKALGAVKRAEWITATVIVISIIYWATDRVHHMPSFLIGMFGLSVFALTGIIRDEDVAGGVSWTLLIFVGGIFGLANVIQEYKITDWLTGYFVPITGRLAFSVILSLVFMALACFLMRFIDPLTFIAIPVLFLPVVDGMLSAPFWLSYQNIWVAMGEGMTSNQAFGTGQRVLLANVYAAMVLVTLVVSVGYWKLIRVL